MKSPEFKAVKPTEYELLLNDERWLEREVHELTADLAKAKAELKNIKRLLKKSGRIVSINRKK